MIKDTYGNEYKQYSGKIYTCEGNVPGFGNVAAYVEGHKHNNGLMIIGYGKLDGKSIIEMVKAMGWRLDDWL